MIGSDILIARVFDNGTSEVSDRYSLSYSVPIQDESQDWILISGKEVNNLTIIELERKLDTKDHQDRAIDLSKATKIIYSYSSSDNLSQMHSIQSLGSDIIWFHPQIKREFSKDIEIVDLNYNFNQTNIYIKSIYYAYCQQIDQNIFK